MGPPLTTGGPTGYLFLGGHGGNWGRPEAWDPKPKNREKRSRDYRGEAIPARLSQALTRGLSATRWDTAARFHRFRPQSLISLQCQALAEILREATPPQEPRVSSQIRAGAKGRYQASQSAHNRASAPRPTIAARTRTPTQPIPAGQKRLHAPDDSERLTDLRSPLRNYLWTGLLRPAWRFVRHLELCPSFGGGGSSSSSEPRAERVDHSGARQSACKAE